MIHLVTDILIPSTTAQSSDMGGMFEPTPTETKVDMYWKGGNGGVYIPEEQLDQVRLEIGRLFDDGFSIESGEFNYEYGGERGVHDPGPDAAVDGEMTVKVFHHDGQVQTGVRTIDSLEVESGVYVVELLIGELGTGGASPRMGGDRGAEFQLVGQVLDAQPNTTLVALSWE